MKYILMIMIFLVNIKYVEKIRNGNMSTLTLSIYRARKID
jgi:hypothetical protein